MPDRRLEGIIELPHSVLVSEDVLGHGFTFRVEDGDAELWLPALPEDAAEAEWHNLHSPLPDAPRLAELVGEGWGRAGFGKHPDHPRPLASWVEKVAFRATVNVEVSRAPAEYAYHFAGQFNAWLQFVEQWIDLWAPHAMARDHVVVSTRGRFWDSSTHPEQLTGWSPHQVVNVVGSALALDGTTLAAAIRRATDCEGPPTEWVFLLRARRAEDGRTAVIEAATAVEVALARRLHDRLSALSEVARERMIVNANGLVGLLRLVEDIEGVSESSWRRVADRLANPRNQAVHAGVAPSAVASALDEATSIVQLYAPLPLPD